MTNEQAADRARALARNLGELLREKQLAYGNSGAIAEGLWKARLAQYRVTKTELTLRPAQALAIVQEEECYLIPASLLRHIPRMTRVDDRMNRLISNPRADRLGENPWMDAAGDCVIGAVINETEALPEDCQELHPITGKQCERLAHAEAEEHRYVHAGGVIRWTKDPGAVLRIPAGELMKHAVERGDPIERGIRDDTP